jgi:hypothetical protein
VTHKDWVPGWCVVRAQGAASRAGSARSSRWRTQSGQNARDERTSPRGHHPTQGLQAIVLIAATASVRAAYSATSTRHAHLDELRRRPRLHRMLPKRSFAGTLISQSVKPFHQFIEQVAVLSHALAASLENRQFSEDARHADMHHTQVAHSDKLNGGTGPAPSAAPSTIGLDPLRPAQPAPSPTPSARLRTAAEAEQPSQEGRFVDQ